MDLRSSRSAVGFSLCPLTSGTVSHLLLTFHEEISIQTVFMSEATLVALNNPTDSLSQAETKLRARKTSITETSDSSLAPRQMKVRVVRTLSRARPPSHRQTLNLSPPASPFTCWTLFVSPNGITHESAARCSPPLSLPTSSLLAPAKTFEVFEQQGNTFAFHLTCLWRPLKYIIAEQHRPPSHPP